MTHITCRLTAKCRDQLRNPTLGNRVWATFTFLPLKRVLVLCWSQLKEQEIKRQFQDAAKTQQKQFKVYRSHQLAKTGSKAEQKELMKRMKEEQLRRMAMLSQQYDASIAEMIERQNVRHSSTGHHDRLTANMPDNLL